MTRLGNRRRFNEAAVFRPRERILLRFVARPHDFASMGPPSTDQSRSEVGAMRPCAYELPL